MCKNELIITTMNTISFDSHLNCTINVPADSAKISFLTNPLFSNTVEDLMTDIRNCRNNFLKSKLERFLQDIKSGRFSFMDYEQEFTDDYEDISLPKSRSDIEVMPDDSNNGSWMVSVHNVSAEHTGFWYAAMNIDHEIQSIKEHIHILSGYLIFAENVDELIGLIKNSTSEKDALNDLLKRGFTELQSVAFLECRLTMLTQLEKGRLTEEIDNYNKLIEILKEYA